MRNELSSESKDFSDFVELINHEFDSMTQPLEEGIKLLEYKIAEYEYTINQINIEVNRRYSKHEFKK